MSLFVKIEVDTVKFNSYHIHSFVSFLLRADLDSKAELQTLLLYLACLYPEMINMRLITDYNKSVSVHLLSVLKNSPTETQWMPPSHA